MITLRDYRVPRDWARPWRDPPGWFTPATGTNSCCSSPCTVGCPAVGTVGTESGSECSACGTQAWLDDFSGTLGNWIDGPGSCGGTIGSNSYQFKISGGRLQASSPSGGTILRAFTMPSLSGLCIQVKSKIFWSAPAGIGGAIGITMSYGRAFFARMNGTTLLNFGRQSCTDSDGCAVAANFATFGSAPVSGDEISCIVRDEGGGDEGDGSIYVSVCYLVNGTVIRVEEGVLWCPPVPGSTMYAGTVCTLSSQTGEWDDFEVRTS